MKRSEVELLLKLLPRYYAHVERYPHTLLIKFFGLHRVKPATGGKVRAPDGATRCCLPSWGRPGAILLCCVLRLAAGTSCTDGNLVEDRIWGCVPGRPPQ
jgi:hypothetical protein